MSLLIYEIDINNFNLYNAITFYSDTYTIFKPNYQNIILSIKMVTQAPVVRICAHTNIYESRYLIIKIFSTFR